MGQIPRSTERILVIIIIIIIIKKEEIKVTLKTRKPLRGHFSKVNKIKIKWRCSRMKRPLA